VIQRFFFGISKVNHINKFHYFVPARVSLYCPFLDIPVRLDQETEVNLNRHTFGDTESIRKRILGSPSSEDLSPLLATELDEEN
jgi:hypothetical protein